MEYGKLFQEKTKYFREELKPGKLDWGNKPETYKSYKDKEIFKLPDFKDLKIEKDFLKILQTRKSIRKFLKKEISLKYLSFLLWCSTGIQRIEYGYEFRTVPSAGALYPVETYICANNIENLDNGIYHYNIKEHYLEKIKKGSFEKQIAIACLSQYMLMTCSVIFLFSGIFERAKWKYKERAYRYIYMEAGHIAQNLALSSVAINLGSCQIGAFFDDELNDIIELDGSSESILYVSAVGYPVL